MNAAFLSVIFDELSAFLEDQFGITLYKIDGMSLRGGNLVMSITAYDAGMNVSKVFNMSYDSKADVWFWKDDTGEHHHVRASGVAA